MAVSVYGGIGRVSATTSARGAFRQTLDRVTQCRQIQARRYVNGYLLALDDAMLATHGIDRETPQRQGAGFFPF